METERKFTLRISDEETKVLNRLKEKLGEKTDTAVIKKIIHNYEELNNRYNNLYEKYSRLEVSSKEKDKKVMNFVNALNELKNL